MCRFRQNGCLVSCLFFFVISLVLSSCTNLDFKYDVKSYMPPLPQVGRVKVALVLGGGGAKGMAHVGVIEELLAEGIRPDLIIGCSAGAIVGGLYADSLDIHQVKNLLWEKRRPNLVNISLGFLPFGLSDGMAMAEFLEGSLRARTFDQLRIPFVAVATNLQFGDIVPLGVGKLIPAIKASAAFPGVFLPVKIHGQYFVDGGVASTVPVEIARSMGAEYVIAVHLDAGLPTDSPTNAAGIMMRSIQIGMRHQSRLATKDANYVIKVSLPNVGVFQDDMNDYIYQRGREAGQVAAPVIAGQIYSK